jgi:hypothetical protein
MTTKSEATILETDVVIFPMKFGQDTQETILTQQPETNSEKVEILIKADDNNRFTRLKKSLRKRSVSIL